MSESLRRLRENQKERDRQRERVSPYFSLAGMANIEELERRATEARKEEEKLKREAQKLEEERRFTTEENQRQFRKLLKKIYDDEVTGIKEYERLIEIAKLAGMSYNEFERILADEKEHIRLLKVFETIRKLPY